MLRSPRKEEMACLAPWPYALKFEPIPLSTHGNVDSVPATHPNCSAKIVSELHIAKSNRRSAIFHLHDPTLSCFSFYYFDHIHKLSLIFLSSL